MESQHTREMDKNRDSDKNKDNARRGSESMASTGSDGMTGNRTSQNSGAGEGTMEQAKTIARNVGEQARNIANTAGSTAQDLARQASEQTDRLYQQGTQASEYLARNVNEYPLTALLIASAIGYGLGYLIHSGWTGEVWSGDERRRLSDRNARRRQD